MSETWEPFADVQPFYTRGLISGTPRMVKSGKEATVFCCQGGAESPAALLALKVYRPRENRTFKNDAIYQEGRVIMDTRQRRAVVHLRNRRVGLLPPPRSPRLGQTALITTARAASARA